MSGKIIVWVVSLILVMGVTIGEDPKIQSSETFIGIICQYTDEQNLCQETLKSVKGLDSFDLKAYITTAVQATTDSVMKALNISDGLITEHNISTKGINILNECKGLLQSAMGSLQLCADMVQNNNIQQVHERDADFRNWLSAVISYESTCTDDLDEDNESEKNIELLTESLNHVEKYTVMTLNIVTGLSQILEHTHLQIH